jgi:mitogen-activated protein kinase kinase 1 interacting protein 1
MAVELFKRELDQLIRSIPGLLAVLIIDRDGVPLIEVHQDLAPELAMQASALSLTVLAADQVSKLGFGKNNIICCEYDNYQVVTFNKLPSSLIVTLIANSSANTGMLLALNSDFDGVLNELRKIKV